MHTNTCKNKFILCKMMHDQIYHVDPVQTTRRDKACGCGCETRRSLFQTGKVAKRVGTLLLL